MCAKIVFTAFSTFLTPSKNSTQLKIAIFTQCLKGKEIE